MAITLDEFLKKYGIPDPYKPSCDKDTVQAITEIINGNIDDYVDSKNGVVLLFIGLYNIHVKEDNLAAEKYYLKAAEYHNLHAIYNLSNLYISLDKPDLAEKYYFMIVEENYIYAGEAMMQLGHLYYAQNKLIPAIRYYIKAKSFERVYPRNTRAIIDGLTRNMQLELLESVPQIRIAECYFSRIHYTVLDLFANKKAEMAKYLSYCLIRDVVGICVAYY
jgi:tetratricopeptide (TPR) repeat protein